MSLTRGERYAVLYWGGLVLGILIGWMLHVTFSYL